MEEVAGSLADEASALVALLQKHDTINRTQLTSFCLADVWGSLPAAWRSALLALTDLELQRLSTDLPVPSGWPDDLRSMVEAARRLAPSADAPPADAPPAGTWLFRGLPRVNNTNPKKEHEVRRLAPLVARVARRCGARTIVDLGSGHGYCSHVLAQHFGLHVIGIEAHPANVAAAHHRACVMRERRSNYKAWSRAVQASAALYAEATKAERGTARREGGGPGAGAARGETAASAEPSPLVELGSGTFASVAVMMPADASPAWLADTLRPALDQLLAWHTRRSADAAELHAVSRYLLVGLHTCGDLAATLLRLAADAAAAAPSDASEQSFRTELGAADAEPAAAAAVAAAGSRCVGVVNVGCCYQRITERAECEPGAEGGAARGAARMAWAGDAAVPSGGSSVSNLPMSAHCRRLGLAVGEVALNHAVQAVWRWPAPLSSVEDTVLKCRAHLYRCVLECWLHERRAAAAPPGPATACDAVTAMRLPREGNVGPLPRCATFAEYARLASERLGAPRDAEAEARWAELWEAHRHLERPLRAFVMLRGLLSRPLERLLLLDRTLFLREAGLHDAQLEEIFDPQVSPRSTAIFASWAEPAVEPAAEPRGPPEPVRAQAQGQPSGRPPPAAADWECPPCQVNVELF